MENRRSPKQHTPALWSRNNIGLRRFAAIILQHAAKQFIANDFLSDGTNIIVRLDQMVVEPLMIALRDRRRRWSSVNRRRVRDCGCNVANTPDTRHQTP